MAGRGGAGGSRCLLYPYLRGEIHLGETCTQTPAIFSPVFPQREDSTSEKIAWSSFSCVRDGWGGREMGKLGARSHSGLAARPGLPREGFPGRRPAELSPREDALSLPRPLARQGGVPGPSIVPS